MNDVMETLTVKESMTCQKILAKAIRQDLLPSECVMCGEPSVFTRFLIPNRKRKKLVVRMYGICERCNINYSWDEQEARYMEKIN